MHQDVTFDFIQNVSAIFTSSLVGSPVGHIYSWQSSAY